MILGEQNIYNTDVDSWNNNNGKLKLNITFPDFKEALSFVNKIGEIAEKMDHHPDICIKNYKNVTISTTTHDAGNKLTDKDYRLAKAIDKLL